MPVQITSGLARANEWSDAREGADFCKVPVLSEEGCLRGTNGEIAVCPIGRCLLLLINEIIAFFGEEVGPVHLGISL